MKNSKSLKERLLGKNIRPSYQRMKIYEYLVANPTHPTVDEIYSALVGDMPTLSKTTVYNTLKLLADHGLVKVITIEGTETRYDGDIHMHGHFKCMACREVYDFNVDLDNILIEDLEGYNIQERDLFFKGICKDCNKLHLT